jgi:hypothetical protein
MGEDVFDGRQLLCRDEKIIPQNKSCLKTGSVFSAVGILIISLQTNESVPSEFQIQYIKRFNIIRCA